MKESSAIQHLHTIADSLCTLPYGAEVGLFFCDLKPSNILFTEDEVLKLSHFGQALRVEAVNNSGPSGPGRRHGTAQYMAPELFSEVRHGPSCGCV